MLRPELSKRVNNERHPPLYDNLTTGTRIKHTLTVGKQPIRGSLYILTACHTTGVLRCTKFGQAWFVAIVKLCEKPRPFKYGVPGDASFLLLLPLIRPGHHAPLHNLNISISTVLKNNRRLISPHGNFTKTDNLLILIFGQLT